MTPHSNGSFIGALLLSSFTVACVGIASGQATGQEQSQDVVRVSTDLVQTAVTVVDRNGKLVDGLQREQFELRVDGKPRSISFFEQVLAGSPKEAQLTSHVDVGPPAVPTSAKPVYRGRTIVFFIDDLHLELQSVHRTREMLLNFINNEMGQRDQVAIASASGQIGFLQQFTNNKEVLKAAVARLTPRPYVVIGYGTGKAPMTEYIALNIDNRSDSKITEFFIEECMKQSSLPKKVPALLKALRETCDTQVRNSARAILLQAADITRQTYASLESLMQSSLRRPGRKLAFFVSDGFLMDVGLNASLSDELMRIIDSAQRAGVVVYTIHAKGLVSGALDATNNVPADPNGRLQTLSTREIAASQDALHALAVDTGGRALRNQNVFDRWVGEMLKETSIYYLLAWRPESAEQKDKKFRKVEVGVIGRPDLSVRVPKGYVEGGKVLIASNTKATTTGGSATELSSTKAPARILGDALADFYTQGAVPTMLSLSYLNTPANGMVLTSSTQIASRSLTFGKDGKGPASVDLAGVVLSDKGKIVTSFKNRLSVNPVSADTQSDPSALIYNERVPLPPGIYQVRVAVRDELSGRVGSAMEWLVVPDIASRQLTLSSVLLGGKVVASKTGSTEPQIQFSVDRRFKRNDQLSYWVFVYNALRPGSEANAPKLTAQVQVLREGQPVVTTKEQLLTTQGVSDPARIPYGGDLMLNNLMAGYYELRVTISDLAAKTSTSQSIGFEVQ